MKNEKLKEKLREVYRPLRRGFDYKGSVHSFEFLQGRRLANKRLREIVDAIRESSFNLYNLGFISDEELDQYRDLCDKLDRFVIVGVEYLQKKEVEAVGLEEYYGRQYDFLEFDNPVRKELSREEYAKAYAEDDFDFFFRQQDSAELKDMLEYYNKL